jgi:hypothetical protein
MLVTAYHVVENVLGNDKPIELTMSDGTIVSRVVDGFLKRSPLPQAGRIAGQPVSQKMFVDWAGATIPEEECHSICFR